MASDRLINVLVFLTLFQLMITIGLGITAQQVVAVAKSRRMVASAALANYVFVPACALALQMLFHWPPLLAAGFLITAVCPGAPYGPPFAGLAGGNVPAAIGLMTLLAGSSAIVSPLLLGVAMPLVAKDEPLTINALKLDEALFLTQLLPLAIGVAMRAWRPEWAGRLAGPAKRLSLVLNVVTVGLIVVVQFQLLLTTSASAFAGMFAMILASVAFGWWVGGSQQGDRVAMAFSTAARNFGVSLVIATSSFPKTQAVNVALTYGLLQTFVLAALAAAWGRWRRPS